MLNTIKEDDEDVMSSKISGVVPDSDSEKMPFDLVVEEPEARNPFQDEPQFSEQIEMIQKQPEFESPFLKKSAGKKKKKKKKTITSTAKVQKVTPLFTTAIEYRKSVTLKSKQKNI